MFGDFKDLMKEAENLQARMAAAKEEIEKIEVVGTAGAGLVRLSVNGAGVLKAVHIDPSLLKPEEGEILEDLLIAAHAEARKKLDAEVASRMTALTGGLPLPFKLP